MSLISPRTVVPSILTVTALLSLSLPGPDGTALRSDPRASSQVEFHRVEGALVPATR